MNTKKLPRLSGADLKIIACISMFIDHLALVLGQTGILKLITRDMIGRLAFPLFAYLLTQGFLHTSNKLRYFRNLLLFAVLSEIPYDLTINDTGRLLPEFTRQNTLFTLTLGFLLLWCMSKLEFSDWAEKLRSSKDSAQVFLQTGQLLLALSFGGLAHFLHVDYGLLGILCIAAMYHFRFVPTSAMGAGCICLNLTLAMPGAFFALLPISAYDKTRGKQNKYLSYLFYPGHLLALFLLKTLLYIRV